MQRRVSGCALLLSLALLHACSAKPSDEEKRAVLEAYRAQAFLVYSDAYDASRVLFEAVDRLADSPSSETLTAARAAWRAARIPYSQTEALRFGHWFVDEWEAKVNSWPVDEGFIDYVNPHYQASPTNPWARSNLIESESIEVAGRTVPLNYIVFKQLQMFESIADAETIVVTGFHALEFMLWGQDTHGTGTGAGERPWTDFSRQTCTSGDVVNNRAKPCTKRGEFLRTVTVLLMTHLLEMRGHWAPGEGTPGYRLVHSDPDIGLSRILFGLVAMSAEELAGERMQVALMTHAPEEEQDCFSDDTHHSLWYNGLGIENFYYGRYRGRENFSATDHSLAALARRYAPELAPRLDRAFDASRQALQRIRDEGSSGRQYVDQLLAADNPEGNALLRAAIIALQHQAALLGELGEKLDLELIAPASFGEVAQ